ncbi:MAG TPA: hypothetical protein VMJ66_09915 [Geobacteraceae bacterium]|nr:hypothetical protein [Geobacteraceae bacterium]
MKFSRLLLLAVALLLLSSCTEAMHYERIADDFVTTYKGYARMIRWHEFDKSTLFYVDDPLREEFNKRIDANDDVKVVDYRVKNVECRPKEGTADVTVDWDYYIPPSVTLKTIRDNQKWRYVEEEKRKGWLLTTLAPDFNQP